MQKQGLPKKAAKSALLNSQVIVFKEEVESFREWFQIPEAEKIRRAFATSGKARRRFSRRRISRKRDRAGAFPKVGKRRAGHSILFGAEGRQPAFPAVPARAVRRRILHLKN
jgi:hypothetical protein